MLAVSRGWASTGCSGRGGNLLHPSFPALTVLGDSPPPQSQPTFPITQNLFPEDRIAWHKMISTPEMPLISSPVWRRSSPEKFLHSSRVSWNTALD